MKDYLSLIVLGISIFIGVFLSENSNFLLAYSRNNTVGIGGPEESFAATLSVLSPSLIREEASASIIQNGIEPIPESVLESAAITGGGFFPLSLLTKNEKKIEELDYFIFPAVHGKNWGLLHHYNAVDIAGNCGVQILAAADGVVIDVASNNTWSGGYGNFILIEHPNKTRTRYAHTLKNTVAKGDVIRQGDKIGLMGNTGNVNGMSGCHVHFEVYGAQNPFVK